MSKEKQPTPQELKALLKSRTIGRIVYLTALSEMLATAVTDSAYEDEYKREVKKYGNLFLGTLDKKLNLMLKHHEDAQQVHAVIDVIRKSMKEAAASVEQEMVEVMMEEYLEEDEELQENK